MVQALPVLIVGNLGFFQLPPSFWQISKPYCDQALVLFRHFLQISIIRKSFKYCRFSKPSFFAFSIKIMTKTVLNFPSCTSNLTNPQSHHPPSHKSETTLLPPGFEPGPPRSAAHSLLHQTVGILLSKDKKIIFKCCNFLLQGVLDLNVILDSQKVGKVSYLLWQETPSKKISLHWRKSPNFWGFLL